MRHLDVLGRAPAIPERPAAGDSVLEVDRVSLQIDRARILEDISISVHAGELLALVGPNGAGKSSLLAVVSGDRAATAGSVRLLGKDIVDWTHAELAVRRSVMLQQTTVAFSFTVRDVVRMGRSPWARTHNEDDDDVVVARALVASDTLDLADRSVPTLSGGELARVAFARVLAQDTPVVLLDEPTASLDLHHQELVMGLVRARVAEGVGAVVVLHDLNVAAAYADRVAVVAAGRLVACGTPSEVLTADLLSRVYAYPVEVLAHPVTGTPLVLPDRRHAAPPPAGLV